MAVQFVLGRSGTGKTSFCVRALADALLESSEQPLLFLVPEQATYQAERAILSDPRIGGYHRLHILSFDRLQFLLLGRNTARPAISRIGRQMSFQDLETISLAAILARRLLPGFAAKWPTITDTSMRGMRTTLKRCLNTWRTEAEKRTATSSIRSPQLNRNRRTAFCRFQTADIGFLAKQTPRQSSTGCPVTSACRAIAADFIRGPLWWTVASHR
jgi:hypothetical protein